MGRLSNLARRVFSTAIFGSVATLGLAPMQRAAAQVPYVSAADLQALKGYLSTVDLRAIALKNGMNSLKTVKAPEMPEGVYKQYVSDKTALQQLGKALFWDQQVGSDGQACASCHFHAGADNRKKNQVNPGFRNTILGLNNNQFDFGLGPNHELTANDFPFHKLTNVDDRDSTLISDTKNVVSSQGVFNATFMRLNSPGAPFDLGQILTSGVFKQTATVPTGTYTAYVRNVEPRNTPTMINAVLNHRNFWDGRGRNEFNGVNPIGSLDSVFVARSTSGVVKFHAIKISDASGASQAVGPPLSNLEMSFDGRTFSILGRKLLDAVPLRFQTIAQNDSVLVPQTKTYAQLIRTAIDPTWWDAPAGFVIDISSGAPKVVRQTGPLLANQFTVMEYNFSLYLGLAINEYEKLLISDDSPFDRFMENKPDTSGSGYFTGFGDAEQRGLQVFLGKGKCVACHGGPELTNASLSNVQGFQILERMIMGNDDVAVYDNGFYNTGVRPTGEDLGVGATIGPFNLPLSNSKLFQNCVRDKIGSSTPSASQLASANLSCEVPGILARPIEAAILLTKAAVAAGSPANVMDLLSRANALLNASPPNFVQGSCYLAQNFKLCGTVDPATGLISAPRGALDYLQGVAPQSKLVSAANLLPDQVNPGVTPNLLAPPLDPGERVAVDGALKTPTIRNVELTAPYFHNGGSATLEQVVEFYNRGGDFAKANELNLDPNIVPLGLSNEEKGYLVAFMKSTTGDGVRNETGYFDHPSLNVPNGGTAPGPGWWPSYSYGGNLVAAMDDRMMIPAVGKTTGCKVVPLPCALGLGTDYTPFANFLQTLPPPVPRP